MFRNHRPLKYISENEWSSHNHLSEAEKQASAGNYSVAVRHMFLALLLYFHENDMVEAKSWKTNWDYCDELRKVNQPLAEQFYHLALLFDEVFYGERVMTRDEYSA